VLRAYDVIQKKRDGLELDRCEIEWFVNGCVSGEVPDYQAAAWLMAVYLCGMNDREASDLAEVMAHSGGTLDLSAIPGPKVDKHSTGGVGDKTTILLAPLLAAAGVFVPKMSGRGLGHSGGTIDKLESVPGFRAALSVDELVDQVRRVGVAVSEATASLAPADKVLYALRDVTATVGSIPLIAASVMSKKIAGGADAIVLDVKTGSGAFVKETDRAVELAHLMTKIGEAAGRKTVALVTDMSQPLGSAVGNALEAAEAIRAASGKGPADLLSLALTLGGHALWAAGLASSPCAGHDRIDGVVRSGRGIEKMREWIEAQGGDPRVVDDPTLLPRAPVRFPVRSPREGYVVSVDAERIGRACVALGAGRSRKGEEVDPSTGALVFAKVGDYVGQDDLLCEVHARNDSEAEAAAAEIASAYTLSDEKPPASRLVKAVVTAEGVEDTPD